jgi:metallo-beta-lactamase class B
MKKLHILLFLGIVALNGFAQETESIRISKDIELIKLSDHVYIHVSYSELPGFSRFPSNGLIYIDNGKGFLFDTPVTDSLTKELVD